MEILRPRNETKCQFTIMFKEADRPPIAGVIPTREYRRMLKDFRRGLQTGTYEMILEGHVSELTFPLQEMDMITVVPIIEVDDGKLRTSDSE